MRLMIQMFLKKAREVDEAVNFVFVQLIERESGIYDKRHPNYLLGRTKQIWLGKQFLMRQRSLDSG
jgi:hypothetical protein